MSITLEPVWRNAFKKLSDSELKPGDIIPKEELEKLFDLKEPKTIDDYKTNQLLFLSEMERLKSALLNDLKLALRSLPGRGYEVIQPEEQTKYGLLEGMKKIKKNIHWMSNIVSNVDTAKLTPEQRKENANAMAKIAMLGSMRRKIARQHET